MKRKLRYLFPLFFLIFFVGQFLGQKILAQMIKQANADEKIIWLKQGVWHWYCLSKSAKTDSIGLRGNEKIIQD